MDETVRPKTPPRTLGAPGDSLACLKRRELAEAFGVCTKEIARLAAEEGLPFIRISSRLTIHPIPAVKEWLAKRTIRTVGGGQ